MAENRFKVEKEEKKNRNLFKRLENTLGLNGILDDGLPVKYLPHIFFVFFLLLIYIGNNHYAEKSVRKIDRLEREVEDLRADYTTLKAEYMLSGKQSEVAKSVSDMDLEESLVPPKKIEVSEDEY